MNLSQAEKDKLVSVLELLRARGIKYKMGAESIGNNPFTLNMKLDEIKELDCSEMVEWVFWNVFKLKVPDGSYNQFPICVPVADGDEQAGDLVFRKNNNTVGAISHVGIYIGSGNVIECMGGVGVIKRAYDQFKQPSARTLFAGIRRIDLSKFSGY